jgi:DNA-binding response OmpR family regulator
MTNSKHKLLIVEDEKSLSLPLKERFLSEGFGVDVAPNGLEGLKMTEESKPDVILLDLIMPEMRGEEFLDRLRENNDTKDIPVIVLTNLSNMESLSKVIEDGVYEYLIKADSSLEGIVERVKNKISNN